MRVLGLSMIVVIGAACEGAAPLADAPVAVDATVDAAPAESPKITAVVGSTRFVTREHMLAASEMQISGEPLAESMGRDLGGYSRELMPPDLYNDPKLGSPWIDLAGFSTGIESYEYSKQPMNNLAFESAGGTSLVYGPLVNVDDASGAAATAHLAALVQHYAIGSNVLGTRVFPPDATNPLGWPGIWPTMHAFRSFDPAIDPTSAFALVCTISSDDTPGSSAAPVQCADYECDATSLHLRDRAAQIDPTITPGADGFSGWKYGLWVLNYLQIMHDATEAAVASVPNGELANVGGAGNLVLGVDEEGAATAPGTFLGSSNIEGFQAQLFISAVDNRAEHWLTRLTTTDGTTLSGFPSLAAALAYDYVQPARWFPSKVGVTETADGSGFPRPAYALTSPSSELLDLVGLALGYSGFYALTDLRNRKVGGAQTAISMFDGDPFLADNQLADGQPTLHDRALAMMRVALVDLDRLHTDPASQLLVDDVAIIGTTATRGHTISTTSLAYTLIGLRTVLRSLSSQLELYSNNTPDTAFVRTPLDARPIRYPGNAALTFTERLRQILRVHAQLLLDHVTEPSGRAWSGWNVTTGMPSDDRDGLDAHTAAIRGLFAGYLATGDVRYRARAIAVFDRVQAVFYDRDARIYGATPAPVESVEVTPLRFALLQSALREVYQLVATRPGGEPLVPILEDALGRLNKLFLNGWDDRDRDQRATRLECVDLVDSLPRGGLQRGERTLTGEAGRAGEGPMGPPSLDRDEDCVPEIDNARLPAGLASSITFEVTRP